MKVDCAQNIQRNGNQFKIGIKTLFFAQNSLSWYVLVKRLQIVAAYFSNSGNFLPLSVSVQFSFPLHFPFLWKGTLPRHNRGIVVYGIDTTHSGARLFKKGRIFFFLKTRMQISLRCQIRKWCNRTYINTFTRCMMITWGLSM